jgi:hypothetical protein
LCRRLASGDKAATYGAHTTTNATTVALAFSPDARLLASAAMDGSVSLFDARAGTKRHTFAAHALPVRALAFSADSSTLITGSDDAQIRVHDVESCTPIVSLSVRLRAPPPRLRLTHARARPQGHTSWVLALATSPDRKRFASGSADKTVRVWDTGNRTHARARARRSFSLVSRLGAQRNRCTFSASTPTRCGRWRGHPTRRGSCRAETTARSASSRRRSERLGDRSTTRSATACAPRNERPFESDVETTKMRADSRSATRAIGAGKNGCSLKKDEYVRGGGAPRLV